MVLAFRIALYSRPNPDIDLSLLGLAIYTHVLCLDFGVFFLLLSSAQDGCAIYYHILPSICHLFAIYLLYIFAIYLILTYLFFLFHQTLD
jgi:hypothetical protein